MQLIQKKRNVKEKIKYVAIVFARFMNLTWLSVTVSTASLFGHWPGRVLPVNHRNQLVALVQIQTATHGDFTPGGSPGVVPVSTVGWSS